MTTDKNSKLNYRERLATEVLFFMLKIINSTTYTHEVTEFKKALLGTRND